MSTIPPTYRRRPFLLAGYLPPPPLLNTMQKCSVRRSGLLFFYYFLLTLTEFGNRRSRPRYSPCAPCMPRSVACCVQAALLACSLATAPVCCATSSTTAPFRTEWYLSLARPTLSSLACQPTIPLTLEARPSVHHAMNPPPPRVAKLARVFSFFPWYLFSMI